MYIEASACILSYHYAMLCYAYRKRVITNKLTTEETHAFVG